MKFQAKESGSLVWGTYDTDSLAADLQDGQFGRGWRFRLVGNASEITLDELLARSANPSAETPPSALAANRAAGLIDVNNHFPVLSFVSVLLRLAGWLFFIVGAVLLVYLVFDSITSDKGRSGLWVEIPGAMLGIFFGLVQVALGEVIGVLFALEANVRRMADKAG